MSNFDFLQTEWPNLAAEAASAERSVTADPRTSCFYARRTLELALQWMYDVDPSLRRPYKSDLSALLFEPTFGALVEPRIRNKMDLIRKEGNAAIHRTRPVVAEEAEAVVRELFHSLFWLARTYARKPEDAPHPSLAFDAAAIPRAETPAGAQVTREALARLAGEQEARDAKLRAAESESTVLQEELAQLRLEVVAAKAAGEKKGDDHNYDEERTRDLFVDVLLKEAGWPLEERRDREFEVQGMPNNTGVGYVDYVLWGDDGKPLGLVEVKRTRKDAKKGQQQAKLYADCLELRFGQRPVMFYTNGYKHWLWDDEQYPPRAVQGFYTKDELALLVHRRTARQPLADAVIDLNIVERHYQHRAIRRIGETFERDRQRAALVVMATGAGKTRTVIALIEQLMSTGWVKRALFLADRVALVNQAAGAFKEHLPDVTTVNLVKEKTTEGRVYVSTYPTMMGLIAEAEGGEERRFGAGFFDLVVIDEAHRAVYQKYRAIFSYFDSLLVGLTATPKDEVDHNTYGLFNLEQGVPTDAYPLDQAVAEGYLVPPRAVTVPLKFPIHGVRYKDLSEAEREQWEEQDWGEDEGLPDEVGADAVNRWLFNNDTVDKVLETLMTRGHKVAGGDRLGKTIIFAKNSDHADFIAERFDANYPEYRGHFARVITFRTEYAQSLIDDFSIKAKVPHIAVSVDMLDTGIDVPEVVNLVFFKTVRSPTKFWQMVGRGTRLCPNLYGPGEDKKDFFVFDCCGNLAFFDQDMASTDGTASTSLNYRLFSNRLDLVVALGGAPVEGDGTASEGGLREDTVALLQAQVAGMNTDNFLVRPHRQLVEHYRETEAWKALKPEETKDMGAHLADLPTAARDDDEAAKRFDLIMLRLQLFRLRDQPSQERLRHQVQEIAAGLLEQTSIPAIREQEELLDDLAGDDWWVGVTVPMLEGARRRVRRLVRLLERRKRALIYTDFTDELGEVAEVELRRLSAGMDFERFREKATTYLRAHEDHVALQKLRRNHQLTPSDLQALEKMLADADLIDAAHLDRARQEGNGLGVFVRSLIGLERSAASAALAGFIGGRTLTANQLDFVNLVVDNLTENGVIDARRLYEPPFTDLAPQGPEGIFPNVGDVEDLFATIEAVRANAEPGERAA